MGKQSHKVQETRKPYQGQCILALCQQKAYFGVCFPSAKDIVSQFYNLGCNTLENSPKINDPHFF